MIQRWDVLLLSGFFCLIPTVAIAQTSQSQTQSACSPNLNESNDNQITIGNCSQTHITNIYNAPVHNYGSEQRSGVTESSNLQNPDKTGRILAEQPIYRISEAQSEGILLNGPELQQITPLSGQIVNY